MTVSDLTYRVVAPEEYSNDDIIEHDDPVAFFPLAAGLLNVRLAAPASSVTEARALIDPIVRAWEFQAEVRMGFPVIKFEFLPAVAVRDTRSAYAPPPRSHAFDDEYRDEELVILVRYPPGPTIRVTPEMENIWERFNRSRSSIGEPLQAAVYYSLTVIEAQFGSRAKAAVGLNLAPPILRKMAELTSTRGDTATARKASGAVTPLTRAESEWLTQAVRHVVLQLGHIAAGLAPQPVSITDLPDLL